MALIDSAAEFAKRVGELALDPFLQNMRGLGISTFGELAFSTDYVPGAGSSELFNKEVVIPVLGTEDNPKRNALRRLFVESYTLAAADLRRKTEPRTDETVEKLPAAEREQRRGELAQRLGGVILQGELEPSHRLLDLAHGLYDENVVKYLDWHVLTKREQELEGTKEVRMWKPNADGTIKEHTESTVGEARTDTDYLLRCALQRRGLALDVGRICRYETHELWVAVLFSELTRTPIPGIGKVTIPILHRADRELWRRIAEDCRHGVRPTADGAMPVDVSIRRLIYDPAVRLLLMPLPASAPARSQNSSGNESADSKAQKRVRQLEQEVANLKRAKADGGGRGSGGSGRGKGGGKQTKKEGKMPTELLGKASRTRGGEPICFNFNLGGCDKAPPGGRCSRGLHVCAEPGCEKPGPVRDHARH